MKKSDFFNIEHERSEVRLVMSGPYEVEKVDDEFVYYVEAGELRQREKKDCIKLIGSKDK